MVKGTIRKVWVPSKYNVYKVTTEHGVSKKMIGESAKKVRTDFKKAMPGVKIRNIQLS